MRHLITRTSQGTRWSQSTGLVALALLFVSSSLVACDRDSGEEAEETQSAGQCTQGELSNARRALLRAAGLPLERPPMPTIEFGPTVSGQGFQVRALRWQHAAGEGSAVHAQLFLPSPLPPSDLPLLINSHGHWGAGLSSREVAGRSQMFAREGWAVLSVATRGSEHGEQQVPPWRQSHYSEGLYGEMRARRGGKTPLGWDVVALWGGLDAALAGRMGVQVRSDAVAVMGFSGGAERAIGLAASDPRIRASVIGAAEYAFATQNGQALCSCGALQDGRKQSPAWLAQLACRPGSPVTERPGLIWQDPTSADARVTSRLQSLSSLIVRPTSQHGVSDVQAAESLVFLEEALLSRSSSPARSKALAEELREKYLQLDKRLHMALTGTTAPGQIEQGLPPWRGAGPVRVASARATLGLPVSTGPRARPLGLEPAAIKLRHARSLQSGFAWVVVVASKPGAGSSDDWIPVPADSTALADNDLISSDAPAIFVRPAVAASAQSDQRASRWSIDATGTALGLAVEDVLEARDRLRKVRGVVPAKIGFVGIGAGAVPALWAAILAGEGGPIALIDAPVTLWWDGPSPEQRAQPWPSWLLPPTPGGAALDPWLAARSLGERVRWLRPRDGSGGLWADQDIPGTKVDTAEQLFERDAKP